MPISADPMSQYIQDTHTPDVSPEMLEEIRSLRIELTLLRGRVQHLPDFLGEVEYGLQRIAAIEKHLGIDRKQVA